MYAAFHGGDAQGSLEHFHPEVTVDISRRGDGSVGRGHEFLSRAIAQWIGTFEDWREEIEEVRDAGDRVYVAAHQHGRGKGSGVELTQRYGIVYEVAGGRIVGMTMYPDRAEAAEAAGLSD